MKSQKNNQYKVETEFAFIVNVFRVSSSFINHNSFNGFRIHFVYRTCEQTSTTLSRNSLSLPLFGKHSQGHHLVKFFTRLYGGFFFFASTSSPPFSASGRFAYPLLLLLRLLQFQLAVNRKHSLVCNVKVIMCAASVNIEECCVGNRLTKRGRWFTE